jgi:hypothetical protein
LKAKRKQLETGGSPPYAKNILFSVNSTQEKQIASKLSVSPRSDAWDKALMQESRHAGERRRQKIV